ncbi:NifB/NifX family molybdenum-iron cluster-binding protein [Eubacterium oxidoreducens]|uniref:Predicted Fe-Mo cluster-binding protein, NifX family n=1 Tax=Eubacterium oxidoreducens TaxID=1732 RepID=A0A1G6C297_EUBOX|nr:NifB/NifX family molybdenum-iron cluster-binding protein [Eubacterium oxidoreducens]SDB26983.1 Predicted Fe-Mo cluster-binding protein, NifX family [Eubacterium oxidoreducens]
MRVGFASTDGIVINEHFGHAKYWEIYDIGTELSLVETRMVRAGCNCHDPSLFEEMLNVLSDCKALFVSKIGKEAAQFVAQKGIRIFEAAGDIEEIGRVIIEQEILDEVT